MKYIVDGYNFLFSLSDATDLRKERESLLNRLNKFVKKAKLDLIIVFDSTYSKEDFQRSHFDAIEVQYTAYGQTADEQIVHLVETHRGNEQITVVTSDRTLVRNAIDLGAKTITIPLFYRWLLKRSDSKEKKSPLIKKTTLPKVSRPIEPGSKEWYLSQFGEESAPKKTPEEKPEEKIDKKIPVIDGELERYLKIFEERL